MEDKKLIVQQRRLERIDEFCKENNYVIFDSLCLQYGRGLLFGLEIETIRKWNTLFVSEDDIPKLVEYNTIYTHKEKKANEEYLDEIYNWLKSIYSGEIKKYYNSDLFAFDFYIPDKNVAIDFNDNYYHSSTFTDANFHSKKSEYCRDNEIRLIHIFEYEWLEKEDILKSLISSALGIYEKRIFARKCEVRTTKSSDIRAFLEENHMQGYVGSSDVVGLYYNDELVQVLTFGKNRFKKNEVELLRMCTKKNTQVIGGFSKLLKHQSHDKFVSYVDLSKYNAQGYLENGFNLLSQSGANYKYCKDNITLNRISAQKHKLASLLGDEFDVNKTERENMIGAGWLQVYDCGNLKLEYTRDNQNTL